MAFLQRRAIPYTPNAVSRLVAQGPGSGRIMPQQKTPYKWELQHWELQQAYKARGYCTTRFQALEGHGFNRAERRRLGCGFSR
jgi:hypothetical protein